MRAVPMSMREGAYAMGSTRLHTAIHVVVPAAISGLAASYILGISRAVGETMILAVAAGMQPNLTWNPMEPAATITSYIVQVALGDLPHGSIGYQTIFAAGLTLLLITLIFNILGQWLRAKQPDTDPARAVRQGFAVMALGVALVVPVLWAAWPLWAIFLGWSVGGFGMGLLFNPTTVAAMTYAEPGREGEVSSQVTLADSVGFSLIGGIGGASVAVADRTSFSLTGALATNFAIALVVALLGIVAAGRVRRADPPPA